MKNSLNGSATAVVSSPNSVPMMIPWRSIESAASRSRAPTERATSATSPVVTAITTDWRNQ